MNKSPNTILSYTNFNSLSNDIIELAKEIMPDKVIYINFLNEMLESLNEKLRSWETEIGNIKLSSSIGAYQFEPDTINDFTALYRKVDSLLYETKKKNKDTYVFESF